MKTKAINLFVNIFFVLALLFALVNPHGLAVPLVVAVVWLVNIVVGVLGSGAVLVLFLEGAARATCKAALRRAVALPSPSTVYRLYGWLLKLLIMMSLAFSGWIITLVCYLLAVVIYNVLRHELAETATA